MQYSIIRSRAGLVALFFALIISLASAVPIPVTESVLPSTLSSRSNPPSLNGQLEDHHDIQLDNARIAKISLSGRTSTLPAATRALSRKHHISTTNMDDQLVRRGLFSGIKHAFQKAGGAIKHGVQKVGSAINHGVKKVGSAIKKVGSAINHGVKKVGSAIKKVGNAIKHGVKKVGSAIKHGIRKVGSAIKHGVEKVKHGIKKVGSAIKHGVKKVGSAIKHGIRKVGHAIKTVAKKVKTVAKKVGHAIKKAAKNVKHFIATTGAQGLKFGLKGVATLGAAAGKVATFVPGLGLPAKLALQGVTKIAGAASDHIHAKLPAGMQRGMDIMNTADKIMNYIPRRREFSEDEDFQQRDISEAYYFEERDDDVALENREDSYFEAEERDIYHEDFYDY